MQTLRSQIFAAARKGDAATVRRGVWEQNVDAAGGELLKGSDAPVRSRPTDLKETLMHIAARNGDLDLVECQWSGYYLHMQFFKPNGDDLEEEDVSAS